MSDLSDTESILNSQRERQPELPKRKQIALRPKIDIESIFGSFDDLFFRMSRFKSIGKEFLDLEYFLEIYLDWVKQVNPQGTKLLDSARGIEILFAPEKAKKTIHSLRTDCLMRSKKKDFGSENQDLNKRMEENRAKALLKNNARKSTTN